MPQWIHQRPVEECNEHEIKVARWLEKLPPAYTICWGFYYTDNEKVGREGDFLILTPEGFLVVLEVKKRIQWDSATGRWTGGGSDAVEQVLAEKSSVLNRLKQRANGDRSKYHLPYIVPVLAGCENQAGDTKPAGLEPGDIWLDLNSWGAPEAKFRALFASARPLKSPGGARRLFLDVFGGSVAGEGAGRALAQTDRQLLLQAACEHPLLDQLSENRVLLVRGGPGSGKSWLAVEAAVRQAAAGRDVLFLCYNLDFRTETEALFQRRRKQTGDRVTVWAWEDLVNRIAEEAGVEAKPPAARDQQREFYAKKLPQVMFEAATSGKVTPRFDALVVDEAQDHDTTSELGISWWEIYLSLLRDPKSAPVYIFLDPAQRPAFRDRDGGKFCVEDLRIPFPDLVRVTLAETRRYTDALAGHLRSLSTAATEAMANGIRAGNDLPGPPPVVEVQPSYEQAKTAAMACVKRWTGEGGVDPRDILILTNRQPFDPRQPLLDASRKFGGHPIIAFDQPQAKNPPFAIRCTSFHKSKGLDAQAVILLHTWPFEDLDPEDQCAYFLAASRARQLLAVFAHQRREQTSPSLPRSA